MFNSMSQLFSISCYVTALILGLAMIAGGGNVKWSKLNQDGKTILIGGYLCLAGGVFFTVVYLLEQYGIIKPWVVLV